MDNNNFAFWLFLSFVGSLFLHRTADKIGELGSKYCATPLKSRRNERVGVWNHRCLDHYSTIWSQKTSKLLVTGLCEVNPPVTSEFPAKRASNTRLCQTFFFSGISQWTSVCMSPSSRTMSLYSLRVKTCYCQISWSLVVARLDVIMIVSFWNLPWPYTAAELLIKFQSDWKSLNANLAASRLHEILR